MAAEAKRRREQGIGHVLAPPRFLAFAAIAIAASAALIPLLGWRYGAMAGFDIGALAFFLICIPLLGHGAERMRHSARENDANRVGLLLITGAVMLVILAAIFSEIMQKQAPHPLWMALIVATLALAWLFSNFIYTLHYAHLFYTAGGGSEGGDSGGLEFPRTPEPNYWDFVYFAYCLGMTFQTSDVTITNCRMRRAVTLHCLGAFVFNLGVLAFSINVLGG